MKMKFHFNPNYISKDKVFEVEVDLESLVLEPIENPQKWYVAADSTKNSVKVYNTKTDSLSNKGCYINSKGLYFKGHGKRYFLKDLEPIKS